MGGNCVNTQLHITYVCFAALIVSIYPRLAMGEEHDHHNGPQLGLCAEIHPHITSTLVDTEAHVPLRIGIANTWGCIGASITADLEGALGMFNEFHFPLRYGILLIEGEYHPSESAVEQSLLVARSLSEHVAIGPSLSGVLVSEHSHIAAGCGSAGIGFVFEYAPLHMHLSVEQGRCWQPVNATQPLSMNIDTTVIHGGFGFHL